MISVRYVVSGRAGDVRRVSGRYWRRSRALPIGPGGILPEHAASPAARTTVHLRIMESELELLNLPRGRQRTKSQCASAHGPGCGRIGDNMRQMPDTG